MEIIDKYKEEIAKIIECKPTEILFYKDWPTNWQTKQPEEVKDLDYYKPTVGNASYAQFSIRRAGVPKGEAINSEGHGQVSNFTLAEMPHCCAIMISCGASINYKYRNKGLGTLLNSFRMDIAKHLGYSLLMCTDIESNEPQRKILQKNGWRDVCSVVNQRTRNKVFVSVINL